MTLFLQGVAQSFTASSFYVFTYSIYMSSACCKFKNGKIEKYFVFTNTRRHKILTICCPSRFFKCRKHAKKCVFFVTTYRPDSENCENSALYRSGKPLKMIKRRRIWTQKIWISCLAQHSMFIISIFKSFSIPLYMIALLVFRIGQWFWILWEWQ